MRFLSLDLWSLPSWLGRGARRTARPEVRAATLSYEAWNPAGPGGRRTTPLPAGFTFEPHGCRVLVLRPSVALVLGCTQGTLWVTRHLDVEDHVLHAGATLAVRAGDVVVVTGTRARLSVTAAGGRRT